MRKYSLHSWQFFVSKRFSSVKAETRTEKKKKTIEEDVRGEGSEILSKCPFPFPGQNIQTNLTFLF